MLQKLLGPKKEDICPNCGEACFATDTLCPRCGKNLDDLFEQLPTDLPKAKPIISLPKQQKFLIEWVLATSIGLALGEVFLSPLAFRFVPFSLPMGGFDLFGTMLSVASGIATGVAIGAFQWLTLRNYISHSWRWIIATPLAMASGSLIQGLLFAIARCYLPMDASAAVWAATNWISVFIYGVLIGLMQSVVLRKSLLKTWTWIITNGFGWPVAIAVGEEFIRPIFYPRVDFGFHVINPYPEIVIYGVVGILIGIITGVLMLWLFKQNSIMIQEAA